MLDEKLEPTLFVRVLHCMVGFMCQSKTFVPYIYYIHWIATKHCHSKSPGSQWLTNERQVCARACVCVRACAVSTVLADVLQVLWAHDSFYYSLKQAWVLITGEHSPTCLRYCASGSGIPPPRTLMTQCFASLAFGVTMSQKENLFHLFLEEVRTPEGPRLYTDSVFSLANHRACGILMQSPFSHYMS